MKITSNALVTLLRAEQDCFKELFEAVDITRRISEFNSSSGSEFQTVGPATGKARRPYVLSRQQGTMSRCRLAERSRCRDATSMAGVTWSARYRKLVEASSLQVEGRRCHPLSWTPLVNWLHARVWSASLSLCPCLCLSVCLAVSVHHECEATLKLARFVEGCLLPCRPPGHVSFGCRRWSLATVLTTQVQLHARRGVVRAWTNHTSLVLSRCELFAQQCAVVSLRAELVCGTHDNGSHTSGASSQMPSASVAWRRHWSENWTEAKLWVFP